MIAAVFVAFAGLVGFALPVGVAVFLVRYHRRSRAVAESLDLRPGTSQPSAPHVAQHRDDRAGRAPRLGVVLALAVLAVVVVVGVTVFTT